MKKYFACAVSILAISGFLTSCGSDDSPAIPGSSLEDKTFTTSTGLTLKANGTDVNGQTVTIAANGEGLAKITIAGAPLNINSLLGGVSAADNTTAQPAFPTSSIIPGSASVSFPVTLTGNSDNVSFTGAAESDYCTFSYEGHASNEALELTLSDIKLKNKSFVGTYKAADNIMVDDGWGGEQIDIFKVFRVDWLSQNGVVVFGDFQMPMNSLVPLALQMTTLPGPDPETLMPVPALMNTVLKSVTFGDDGSVTAKYADTSIEGWPTKESPKGFARYVVKEDGTLQLFIDPAAIIAATVDNAGKSRALDVNALLEGAISIIAPMLQNGVPVHYGKVIADAEGNLDESANAVSFYLGTETLLPILKLAAPVISDEEVMNAIVEAASKDPNMGMMAEMLPNILSQLPAVIETTSKVELGINLYK